MFTCGTFCVKHFLEKGLFSSASLVTFLSLFLILRPLCHPLLFLMPPPSPTGASSLLHSTNKSGNYAWWQCEHNVCCSGFAHALRQVDAELRGPDTRG